MNLDDLFAQIEQDYSWRIDEIRFLENQLSFFRDENRKEKMRRAIILVLYSHFEGFSKFCFLLYIQAINSARISCNAVNSSIAVASLSELFKQLRNPDKKSDLFRHLLPEDTKLHTFARDKEFLDLSHKFLETIVEIPITFIDLESNLKPTVLRKILFQLGFAYDIFKQEEGAITILLKFRNGIGHGEYKAGITLQEYNLVKKASSDIMTGIKRLITSSLYSKAFLKEEDYNYNMFASIMSDYNGMAGQQPYY